MCGKQILLDALQNKTTGRTPWIPFVGVHGGKLIGVTASEYLQSADHMVAGLLEATRRYQPDGLPIVFDLQIEAEVLGCDLVWSEDSPPSVSSHPLALESGKELADLPAFSVEKGRIPLGMEVARRLRKEIGEQVALYGLICGPFTLALHLMGNDIFLEMFDHEERVQEILDFSANVGIQMAQAYVEAGCDVIAVVDPMVSLISPNDFEKFAATPCRHLFDAIRAQGALSSMFVCGNATRVLENLATSGCDNFSIDENIDLAYAKQLAAKHQVSFGGNLQLTVTLLLGDADSVRRDVVHCLDVGDSDGYLLAPGCDLPYHTPPENVEVVAPIVRDDYQREIARTLQAASSDSYDDVLLTNYKKQKEVTLDVITLDSQSCPPCQYLVEAALRAAKAVGEGVVVHEHKITSRQGLGIMAKLGVSHIPTLCIEGEVVFPSTIPDAKTLEKAVRTTMEAKR